MAKRVPKKMTNDELNTIFNNVGKKSGLRVSAKFASFPIPNIRWRVDKKKAYVEITDYLDELDEKKMTMLAKNIVGKIVAGPEKIAKSIVEEIEDEIRKREALYKKRINATDDDGDVFDLMEIVDNLMRRGAVDPFQIEGMSFGWMTRKCGVIGCNSRINRCVHVSKEYDSPTVPTGVVEAIVLANILAANGLEWEEPCRRNIPGIEIVIEEIRHRAPRCPRDYSCPFFDW